MRQVFWMVHFSEGCSHFMKSNEFSLLLLHDLKENIFQQKKNSSIHTESVLDNLFSEKKYGCTIKKQKKKKMPEWMNREKNNNEYCLTKHMNMRLIYLTNQHA